MKTTAKQTESSQAVQAKVNKQDSVNSILQRYKDKTTQRQSTEEEELLQGKFETVQRMELDEEEPLQGKFETTQLATEEEEPLQRQPNNTGLPDNLKSGIENLSGYSMDDVKVHYNSSQPATLQAHAYAQGTNIHIAPGQEKHLPHEAWHVVQQKQGRVKPTMQLKSNVPVNDDAGLEKEADVMGTKAINSSYSDFEKKSSVPHASLQLVVQQKDKNRSRKKHPVKEPSYKNLKRMDEQSPEVEVDEDTGVLHLKLYDGYQAKLRYFDFSLTRHWFPWLSSSANEKNSIMYHDISESDIESDAEKIGIYIIANIWGSGPVEPNETKYTTESGRKYQLDIVGSSNELNHFFVISGTKVTNINQSQYLFFRALSMLERGDGLESEAKALYKQIDGNLSHTLIEAVSGVNIGNEDGLNIPDVIDFLEKAKAYLDQEDNPEYIAFSKLNKDTWDIAGNGKSIFYKTHKEIAKAYDQAKKDGKIIIGDWGFKL